MNKTMAAILRVLEGASEIIGSREVSRRLKAHGVDLTERTVRYHMRIMDERGYTEVYGKEGRRITDKGKSELKKSNVSERIGFMSARIESMSYLTTLNMRTMKGTVLLNVSFIPEKQIRKAVTILQGFFSSPFAMCDRMIIVPSGEHIGALAPPKGEMALGTICSVTINGLFRQAGIPVTSRYGGVLEVVNFTPTRFTSLISYEGSSLDPLEVFIRGKMTDITGCVRFGSGSILASFREIPVVCLNDAATISKKMTSKGIRGVLHIGRPNSPFLDIPVGIDKAGIAVAGGLNPIAVLDEAGILTRNMAMSALIDYQSLRSFDEIAGEIL